MEAKKTTNFYSEIDKQLYYKLKNIIIKLSSKENKLLTQRNIFERAISDFINKYSNE